MSVGRTGRKSKAVSIELSPENAEALLNLLYAIRNVARSALVMMIVQSVERALGRPESM